MGHVWGFCPPAGPLWSGIKLYLIFARHLSAIKKYQELIMCMHTVVWDEWFLEATFRSE